MSDIHFFYGTESFLVEEALAKMLRNCPTDQSVFEGVFEWQLLKDALSLSSLFSSEKTIIIKNPWFASKAVSDSDLIELKTVLELAKDSDYPVLMMNLGAVDQRKKAAQLLKKATTVHVFDPYKDWELDKVQGWLNLRAKEKSLEVEADALWALTENCGTHLRQLAGELDKLSVYIGDRKKINLSDVRAVCLGPQGSIYDFTEALKKRNLKLVMSHLNRLFSHSEDPIKLLGLITASIRLYLQILSGLEIGLNGQDIGKSIGKNPFFLKRLIPEVKAKYTVESLKNALSVLADSDRSIKSGRVAPKMAVELALLSICSA